MDLEPNKVRDAHREYERAREAVQHRQPDAHHADGSKPLHISVSVHDNHSLEVKSAIEYCQGQRFDVNTEIYLFLPGVARAHSWQRDELMGDFHGQVRLSVPCLSDNGRSVLEEAKRCLGRACQEAATTRWDLDTVVILESDHPVARMLVDEGRRFAAVFSEVLGSHSARHRRQLREAIARTTDLDAAAGVLNIKTAVGDVGRTVSWVRIEIDKGRKTTACVPGAPTLFELLDEYIGRLYVNYLGRMSVALSRLPTQGKKDTALQLDDLADTLVRLSREEAQRDSSCDAMAGDEAGESAALRLSHLKKFFQSPLYFETVARQTMKRFSEPAAVAGACLAATGAYAVEIMRNPAFKAYAGQGALVVCFGIFLYVLKDRLKDRFRSQFMATISQRFPESEQYLLFRKVRVGICQNWFKIMKKSDLPTEAKDMRRKAALTSIEQAVSEDVLYYRQRIRVEGQTPHSQDGQGSMRGVVRINLERYLRFLDDPYKNLFELNRDGSFTERKAHKVYHFYLLTRASAAQEHVKSSIFRVIMDKQGINRIEAISQPS